jgi:hypothetical protein
MEPALNDLVQRFRRFAGMAGISLLYQELALKIAEDPHGPPHRLPGKFKDTLE